MATGSSRNGLPMRLALPPEILISIRRKTAPDRLNRPGRPRHFTVMALREIAGSVRASESSDAVAEERARWIAACESACDKVYRAVVAMGATPPDAADAVQDAVEHALRLNVPGDRPEGWLFVVALRSWKRQRWRQRLFSPLDALRGMTYSEQRDEQIALVVELAKLTDRQRTVLIGLYALGLSQKEIARILNIAPGTVGSIASQASKKLRQQLGEEP